MLSFDINEYDIYSEKDLSAGGAAVLKKKEGRTIKSGGLWVYDNEIAEFKGAFEDGSIIAVEDFDGYFMGYGFVNRRSKITVRLLSRRREHPVTPALLTQRVRDAWEYRKKVIDTSSCRLIFGEADFLPGLTVDKYEDVLVVESLALGIDRLKGHILAALVKVLSEDGIQVRGIYERSDAKVRELEGLPREKGFLTAPFDTKIQITENGVRYIVDIENGQKTGFFLDQKDNRRAIHRLCGGAKVLDCFTHTREGPGLLYAHRVICPERGSGRRFFRAGSGRVRSGCRAGEGERAAQRRGRPGLLLVQRRVRSFAGAHFKGRAVRRGRPGSAGFHQVAQFHQGGCAGLPRDQPARHEARQERRLPGHLLLLALYGSGAVHKDHRRSGAGRAQAAETGGVQDAGAGPPDPVVVGRVLLS